MNLFPNGKIDYFIIVVWSSLFVKLSIVVSSWISITSSNNNQKKKSSLNNNHKLNPIQTKSSSSLFLEKQSLGSFEQLTKEEISYTDTTKRKVRLLDYTSKNDDYLSFNDAYNTQLNLLNQQLKRIEENRKNNDHRKMDQWYNDEDEDNNDNYGYDCIIFLEHKPVYTLGRASDPSFILNNNAKDVEICNTDRGGEVTYHGPGQIVVYPILDLRGYRKDVHWYIRALEEVILQTLYSLNIKEPTRSDDFTGIYVFDDTDTDYTDSKSKIASIGIKLRRWVTMHGLSVNINDESLHNFQHIIPCGLVGFNVTCVNSFLP